VAIYKATMHFEGEFIPPSGFSESWEYNRTSDDEAAQLALELVGERKKYLSQNWAIRSVRVARLTPNGVVENCKLKAVAVQVNGCIADAQGLLGPTDTPWTAVYIEIPSKQSTPSVSTPPRPRRYQMRGIPDTWWDGPNQALSAEVGPATAAWMAWIVNVMKAGDAKPNAGCSSAQIQPYLMGCVRRISSRRIGRPFGLLRGRRSARPVVPPVS